MVYSIGDWDNSDSDDYFFKEEVLQDQHYVSLLPYRSDIRAIYHSDVSSEISLDRSIERLKEKLSANMKIDGSYTVIRLLKLLSLSKDVSNYKEIANSLGIIHQHFLRIYGISPLNFTQKISSLDEIKAAKLLAYCDFFKASPGDINSPKEFADLLIAENKIGPIVFTCPELGRFSTSGGLGIMIDELSQGLVNIGEEVWVISPYYERNKRGQTGYLSNDPANIN